MNDKLKEFIEQNIDLIENNDFDELYRNINGSGWKVIPKDVSEALLEAGINPMRHMSEVPEEFLYLSNIDAVDICDGIEVIKHAAFGRCKNLLDVYIPEGVYAIESRAFMFCSNLHKVSLPSTLQLIDYNAFQGCKNLTDLHFRGTVDQFLHVKELDDSLRESAHRIICSDGIFDFE